MIPVCRCHVQDEGIFCRQLFGTAFFIGSKGFFLTARHVIGDAVNHSKGQDVFLVAKKDDGTSHKSVGHLLSTYEFADAPYDVAVGKVNYKFKSPLKLTQGNKVSHWQEVASIGYPETSSDYEASDLFMNLRAFKGYVHRETLPSEGPFGRHPNGYELSFLPGKGASGAPVFTVPDEKVIGVAVSSFRSERELYEQTDVLSDGSKYVKKR